MPVVPFTAHPNQSQPIPKVDQTFLMMAAAELHEAGRLAEPSFDVAGDVVQSGLSQRLHDIRKETAPVQPQLGVPTAKVVPIGKG